MSYQVLYHPLVKKIDIPKLDRAIGMRVKHSVEAKLMTRPEIFGVPLRHAKKGERKLRVGDYRVIFRITGLRVKIYLIEHRSVVYQAMMQRLNSEQEF